MVLFTFQFEEDPFAKNAQFVGKTFIEVFLLLSFLQTKPQNKSMNNTYFDWYFTVNKKMIDGAENGDLKQIISSFLYCTNRDAKRITANVVVVRLIFIEHHLQNT